MANMQCALVGNIGGEIREFTTKSGKQGASFSIACADYPNEQPVWWEITAWGTKADFVLQYAEKGMQVTVFGRMTDGSYEGKDGPVKKLKVMADDVILPRKAKSATTSDGQDDDVPF